MLKRTIPLLLAVAVVLVAAAPAEAGCARCRFAAPDWQYCIPATSNGWTECYEDPSDGTCHLAGDPCTNLSAAVTLAGEYDVASVERTDEMPAPDETLVVSLDAPQTAAGSTR